ncbi:hypothetical protein AAHA92_21480 [Salvia divinorum]|uniref:Uncharacterized protein n=1 Tax=Salvia divinorum TaxID=28513 RepID=A0ABD1GNL9_SALDI
MVEGVLVPVLVHPGAAVCLHSHAATADHRHIVDVRKYHMPMEMVSEKGAEAEAEAEQGFKLGDALSFDSRIWLCHFYLSSVCLLLLHWFRTSALVVSTFSALLWDLQFE